MVHPTASTAPDAPLFDTAPPDEARALSSAARIKQSVGAALSKAILPLAKRAAGAYLGGETLDEALGVAKRLQTEGLATTLGYWDTGADNAISGIYQNAMDRLGASGLQSYLSLKPPALRFSRDSARALGRAATLQAMRLHCDCHGPDTADMTRAFAEALGESLPPQLVGFALPGRWQRSLQDADWAMAQGFNIRVVKGQWPDPEDRTRGLGQGFLAVIDRLCAGSPYHVAVATHDAPLAREAITRLQAAGVSHEIEVLLGYPAGPILGWAKDAGIKTRIYVPYGPGFVPNAIAVLRRNPRLLLAVARERTAAILRLGRASSLPKV